MKLSEHMKQEEGVICLTPSLVEKIGLKVAYLLGQLINWSEAEVDKDGWFVKSSAEIEKTLGLTPREQTPIRKALRNLGILEEKQDISTRKQMYRINQKQILTKCGIPTKGTDRVSTTTPSSPSSLPHPLNTLNTLIEDSLKEDLKGNRNRKRNRRLLFLGEDVNEENNLQNPNQTSVPYVHLESSGQLTGDLDKLESNLMEVLKDPKCSFTLTESQMKNLIRFNLEEYRLYLVLNYNPVKLDDNLYSRIFSYLKDKYLPEREGLPDDLIYLDYIFWMFYNYMGLPSIPTFPKSQKYLVLRRLSFIVQKLEENQISIKKYIEWFMNTYMREHKVTSCFDEISRVSTFEEFYARDNSATE